MCGSLSGFFNLITMSRLDKDKQLELEPKRINYAIQEINKKGLQIVESNNTKIVFLFNNEKITLFPYSGYFNGKGIKAGRGINNLLKQI